MEFQVFSWPIVLSFLLFMFTLLKISKTKHSTSNLPPGPWKLPLIGNIHQLLSSLPHHALRDLAKKHGPLMFLQLGEVSTVVVSSPECAEEVMKTHDPIFASRPHFQASKIASYDSLGIVFAPYGNHWKQLRKICTLELLSAKRVESFRPIREEEQSHLIKWIASKAGSPINLTEKVLSSPYSITTRAAFGKKYEDQDKFISLLSEAAKVAGGFSIAELFPSVKLLLLISGMKPKLERLHQEIDMIMENIINEHKERKEKTTTTGESATADLVDVLLKLQEHGDREFTLTTKNIKAVILDIFGAGGETSAIIVDWAMSEMIKNSRLMKRAQAEVREVFNRKGRVDETSLNEMTYLKLVIKETLRLHPPGPLIPRECGEKCQINGYEIPVKTKVIVNAWAIGRDPKYWIEPESFDPQRFLDSSINFKGANFEYIPFGAGRKICPGMSFGLINVELQLALLLYHFDWELPNGMKHEELDMTEVFGVTVRRRDDLHLIPITYRSSIAG